VTERTIDVPGGRLHVVDEGDPTDPPIVLLHAGIADLRSWNALVPLLTDQGSRVIRLDARSFGRSTTDDVEFSDRADVVAVLDALGIGQAVLVGNSRGGRIALETAIEYPDRVVGVVALASGLGGFDGDASPVESALVDEMDALESAQPMDPVAIADVDIRLWVDGAGQPPTRVPARIRDAIRRMDEPNYRADRVDGRPIELDPPAVERLGELRCPVLAVAGALDLGETSQAARLIAERALNARAEVVPDVAHMIAMEAPALVADLIADFVAPLDAWR
jgi:pimeloyl-ACP methyl ester carboxylesterase